MGLSLRSVKQLVKILLSMHGLKGTVRVERSLQKYSNFDVYVSNIKRITYDQVYYPIVDKYMDEGEMERFFRRSTFNNLSHSIINSDWEEKVYQELLKL